METMAHPIKKAFHSRRCASEKTALARFRKVFREDTDQEKINEQFSWYTKRLQNVLDLGGKWQSNHVPTKYEVYRFLVLWHVSKSAT